MTDSPKPTHVHTCSECNVQQVCTIKDCQIVDGGILVYLCEDCQSMLDYDASDYSPYEEEFDSDDDDGDISDIDNVPEDKDF